MKYGKRARQRKEIKPNFDLLHGPDKSIKSYAKKSDRTSDFSLFRIRQMIKIKIFGFHHLEKYLN